MDKTMKTLLTIFFLSFTIFVSILFFNKPLARFTRAKEDLLPSQNNSLIFAYPLSVKADGKAQSVINVFVRSDKGMPVKDQKIKLSTSLGMITETEGSSDDQGKSTFHLSSTTTGIAQIEATVGDSLRLTQKLSVKFE